MEVKIKAIHFDAAEKLEEFINKKAQKLARRNESIATFDVTLKVVKPETAMNKEAAIKLLVPNADDLFASKVADTFEEAVDLAIDALDRQLVKIKDKKKAMAGSQVMKNLWLHKAGERLKWLALKKTAFISDLLKILHKERTLTFCGSIEQTEVLGQHCIHSKNRVSLSTLNDFNEGKINHITAVAMLDEGQNLTNCRVGIFANINSSDRIQVQRTGRILRHNKPIIIIPYFTHSREEELVQKMLDGYNPDLIKVIPKSQIKVNTFDTL